MVKYYFYPATNEKYRAYFKSFGLFVQKWWDILSDNEKIEFLLRLLWYGKVGGEIPFTKYWIMKSHLLTIKDYARIYSYLLAKSRA